MVAPIVIGGGRNDSRPLQIARMVELVDTLVSGTSGLMAVQVRVLFRAQINFDSN